MRRLSLSLVLMLVLTLVLTLVGSALWLKPALAQANSSASTTPSLVASVPAFISQQIPQAKASNASRFRWFAFSVYDARLYSPPGFKPAQFGVYPFALELTYLRDLKGAAIAERSDEEIAKLGYGTAAQRSEWLKQMRALFPNVSNGKRLTGIHLPQQGAVFFVDDQPLGEIRDPEFSKAFFAIWLDERTSAPGLRAALLGQP